MINFKTAKISWHKSYFKTSMSSYGPFVKQQ